jgi:hypothetical protein
MPGWSDETIKRKSEEWQSIAIAYESLSSDSLAHNYAALYEQVAENETMIAPIKRRLEVVKALLAERFAEEGKKSVKFEDGSSVSVRFTTPYSVEDKPAFITWLKENGMQDELTVSAARCAAIAKNVYEETQKVPDGLVAGDPTPVVTFRK